MRMIYRAAIFFALLSACTVPRVTVDARPQQTAAVATWQRQMTQRINAVVECLGPLERVCIDEREKGE